MDQQVWAVFSLSSLRVLPTKEKGKNGRAAGEWTCWGLASLKSLVANGGPYILCIFIHCHTERVERKWRIFSAAHWASLSLFCLRKKEGFVGISLCRIWWPLWARFGNKSARTLRTGQRNAETWQRERWIERWHSVIGRCQCPANCLAK